MQIQLNNLNFFPEKAKEFQLLKTEIEQLISLL